MPSPALWASLAVALLVTLFHSTPLEKRVVAERSWMHGNHRGVEKERWYVARHRLIGDFFARYARPNESLATRAIGAIAEKPELFGRLLILVGLAEGIAIYGLIISILILDRLG